MPEAVAVLLAEAWQALRQSSPWELVAMVLAVIYLLLAVRENIWCWAAALISTLIYTGVFLRAQLYMDSALQVFYALMAIYGWSQWRHHRNPEKDVRITTRSPRWHATTLMLVILVSAGSGTLLKFYTQAAFPYLDSLTTWASVIATWMVARKILENWIYWIAIDSLSIYLYLDRGLYLTVILFVLYVIIAFVGWHTWKLNYQKEQ